MRGLGKDKRELLCRSKNHFPESKFSVDLRCNPIADFAPQNLHNYLFELVHSRPTRWSLTNNAQNYKRTITMKRAYKRTITREQCPHCLVP